ncbi:MAG: glycosyltransferase family 2 protein [Leptospirillia bacterium]
MPRISVVTPSFNQARYVGDTICSVVGQGYPNLEYLVIDGGSTDGSRDVIASHGARLAYWVSEPDRGQTDAINKGLAKSTGEIVAYLNSDDLYLDDTFERVADFFTDHPEVDIVYSDLKVIDGEGVSLGRWKSRPFDRVALLCRNFIFQPTVFIRRRVLDKIGRFDEALHYVMDVDFWYRASNYFRFHYLSEPLAVFRLHDESKTGQSRVPFVREREMVLARFLAACDDPDVKRHRDHILAWHHYHGGEQLHQRGEVAEAANEFRAALRLDLFSLKGLISLSGVIDDRLGTHLYPLAKRLWWHKVRP